MTAPNAATPSDSKKALKIAVLVSAVGLLCLIVSAPTLISWVPRPPDLTNPNQISRPGLALTYPGNWTVDTTDSDYDLDRYFDINAPGNGTVMVQIVEEVLSPDEAALSFMKKFQATTLRNATVYSIPWGGAGAALEGKGTLFLLPGRIRVAVFPGKTATCIVTELRFNDDERMNKAGYDLIERSLKFSR